ncbi:mandelate racemase/muconate lactonizing enzyme family protein [Candidatus Poribacteria bacterium]|nr:mandelate racemase/muconate lactonizing enzyme family protein [Candidatus Poribacteria bacterium]
MKITDIECFVLLVPDFDAEACSSAQDNIVVRVHTDEGLVGIGETDTNPWAVKALIEAPGTHCMGLGLKEMLIGQDPLQVEALWEKLYIGSAMNGRRGLGICAMGALDMALWDIRGKAEGKPIWKLLGGAKQSELTPYASRLPVGNTLAEYRESLVAKAKDAVGFGFSAIKAEVCIKGPYSHNRLQEKDEDIVDVVAAVREAIGPDITLMVDVAYTWRDFKEALRVMRQLEPYDLFFLETPLSPDDLDGHARLAHATDIRLAAGEWLNSRFEFIDLIDRGLIDVAQPDVGRVGGLTEARRVVAYAQDRGRLIVPHCWKTGIGIAASAHLCAIASNAPFMEFLPAPLSESKLRQELVADEIALVNGRIPLPEKPGLGIELNEEALVRYQV